MVFRIGLSIYLMLVTLAGPWLCCCQQRRFSAQLAALLKSTDTQSPERGPACCRHHRAPVKKSQMPAPSDAPCPCRHGSPEAAPPVLLQIEGARQLHLDPSPSPDLLACPSLSGIGVPSANLTLATSPEFCPVSPGRQILSLLHILRC